MLVLTAGDNWAPTEGHLAQSGFLDGTDVVQMGSVPLIPGPDGTGVTASYTTLYRSNPWLFAAIQLKARGFARMPYKLHRDRGDEGKQRVRANRDTVAGSLAYVMRRPGDGRSWQALQHATAIDRSVHGNAVWFPDRDRRGRFLAMRRVPFRFVRVEEIAGELRYWDSRKPKAKRLRDDVIHFGAWHDGDQLFNSSPIAALHVTLALYDAIERHLTAFFKNSARPSGMIEVDRATTPKQRKIITDAVRAMYSSPENAGKVLVTSGKWSSVTQNADNSKVIELVKQAREEIAAVIGVPPPLIGILDRAIMSNVRELRSHFARDVMGPDIALYEGDIDAQILAMVPELVNVVGGFEMAAVLRPDLEARSATWKNQRYVRSLNEIRATEDLPRIDHPDADMPWMPLNEQPLGSTNAPDDKGDPGDDEGSSSAGELYRRPDDENEE